MENTELLKKTGIYNLTKCLTGGKNETLARIAVLDNDQPITCWSTEQRFFDVKINDEIGLIFDKNNFIKKLEQIERNLLFLDCVIKVKKIDKE